jgi:hypothetical protein
MNDEVDGAEDDHAPGPPTVQTASSPFVCSSARQSAPAPTDGGGRRRTSGSYSGTRSTATRSSEPVSSAVNVWPSVSAIAMPRPRPLDSAVLLARSDMSERSLVWRVGDWRRRHMGRAAHLTYAAGAATPARGAGVYVSAAVWAITMPPRLADRAARRDVGGSDAAARATQTRSRWIARMAASARDATSSLARMAPTCFEVVRGLMKRSVAISRSVLPATSRRSTSSSRGDRPLA